MDAVSASWVLLGTIRLTPPDDLGLLPVSWRQKAEIITKPRPLIGPAATPAGQLLDGNLTLVLGARAVVGGAGADRCCLRVVRLCSVAPCQVSQTAPACSVAGTDWRWVMRWLTGRRSLPVWGACSWSASG